MKDDISTLTARLNNFLSLKHDVLAGVYAQASEAGPENTTPFLFQPEVLMLYELLSSDLDRTRQVWMQNDPEAELEKIANTFGISLD